jgi:HAD superfamily phosphoserine phosphatase-like hydrolase
MNKYDIPDRDPALLPPFVAAMEPDGHGKLAIVDADGTMWRGDVADDFTNWMIETGKTNSRASWREYLKIYRDDHAAGCQYLLRFFEGMDQKTLHHWIWHWWDVHAHRHWVPEVLEALHWLRAHHYTTWVVTGSPTDFMLPLKDVLPVHEVVGMDFEQDPQGVFTGRYAGISCADEGKAEKVRALWGSKPVLFSAGNGKLDTWMMECSSAVIWSVYPNREFLEVSKQKGWHITPRPPDFVEEAKLA